MLFLTVPQVAALNGLKGPQVETLTIEAHYLEAGSLVVTVWDRKGQYRQKMITPEGKVKRV